MQYEIHFITPSISQCSFDVSLRKIEMSDSVRCRTPPRPLMVPVPVPRLMVVLTGIERLTVKVSSGSKV